MGNRIAEEEAQKVRKFNLSYSYFTADRNLLYLVGHKEHPRVQRKNAFKVI